MFRRRGGLGLCDLGLWLGGRRGWELLEHGHGAPEGDEGAVTVAVVGDAEFGVGMGGFEGLAFVDAGDAALDFVLEQGCEPGFEIVHFLILRGGSHVWIIPGGGGVFEPVVLQVVEKTRKMGRKFL